MLGIYTRLSVQDDDSNSISNQKREGVDFAKRNNFTYQIYDEGEGVSATNDIVDRPLLDELLKDIVSKKITHVWFRNQNRLERNSNTFHLFASIARKNNVKVYFNDKLEDWEDPSSFLKSSILTALNEYQTSLQSYQTKKSLLDNAKQGKSFGVYPYGYKSDENGYLVIDEEEKEIVELIFKMSLEGTGTRSIAEHLNAKNIPTRYNKIGKGTITVKNKFTEKKTIINKKDIKWSGNSVRGIIINPIYKGQRKWKNQFVKSQAIFEEGYWQKVNDNLAKNRNNSGKKVEHKYLLKGVLECGKCGRNMYGRTRVNKKDHYYMCSSKRYKELNCGNRSINIDFIEYYLWNLLFQDYEIKKSLLSSKKDDRETNINRLNASRLKILEENERFIKERKRVIDFGVKGIITEMEMESSLKNIDLKQKDLSIKLKNINDEISYIDESEGLEKSLEKDIENLQNNAPFNRKEYLIRKYIQRVKITFNKDLNTYFLAVHFKINNYIEVFPVLLEPKNFRKYVETGFNEVKYPLEKIKRIIAIGENIKNSLNGI